MSEVKTILYVHGMGGGGDSRIPSILKDLLGPGYTVVIRTYDFDPEVASGQLAAWAAEVHPDLVIGESMGAIHAVGLRGYPHHPSTPLCFSVSSPPWLGSPVSRGSSTGTTTLSPGIARHFISPGRPF